MLESMRSKSISSEKRIWRVCISNGIVEKSVEYIPAESKEDAIQRYRDKIEPHPLLPIMARITTERELRQFSLHGGASS